MGQEVFLNVKKRTSCSFFPELFGSFESSSYLCYYQNKRNTNT